MPWRTLGNTHPSPQPPVQYADHTLQQSPPSSHPHDGDHGGSSTLPKPGGGPVGGNAGYDQATQGQPISPTSNGWLNVGAMHQAAVSASRYVLL